MSDVIITSSYGNLGIGSCGVGIVSEGGVIGFGDDEERAKKLYEDLLTVLLLFQPSKGAIGIDSCMFLRFEMLH